VPDAATKSPWLGSATRSFATSTTPGRNGAGELVNEVMASFPTCPIQEVARLGRTLTQWKSAILAYFDTQGASNGPTEAITASSETPAESPAASATSPTTGLDATRRRRTPPLPDQIEQPCLNAKGQFPG
jgi:hypothetical protein